MSHKLELVAFHGDSIPALRDGETVRIAIRPVCDTLGLNFDGQRRRLERQPWATVVVTTSVGADGKARGMGEAPQPITGPGKLLYTSDFLKGKNLSAARTKSVAGMFGKRVKQAYIDQYDREPGRYPLTLPNGQTRDVYAYTEADRPLMEQVWKRHYSEVTA